MKKKLCLQNFVHLLLAASMIFTFSACGGGGDSPFSSSSGGGGGGVTALAADQNVSTNTIVTLDGSRSTDPQGGQLHYSWHFVERPEGSQATLSNPSAVRPTFTPDKDGVYLIILVVTNSRSESADCFITVTAASGNSAPVANPGGNQNVTTGNPVTLDGSASSDADGNTITYSWAFVFRPFGSQAALSNPSAAKPTFTPDMDGQYVLALIVFDGTTFSAPVTITITASTNNSTPIANPGVDQNVAIGNLVTLDGSQSSVSGSATLTYSWSFVSKPAGSEAELSSLTAVKPTFLPDVSGDYVISLIVHDGIVSSSPVTVTITASIANSAPVAHAGVDQNVAIGSTVTLDGSASSDADGDNLVFSWSFTSRPEGSNATLSSTSAVKPTFMADMEGDYVLRLVVNDGLVNSHPTSVTISAATANSAPVANPGVDQNVATGSTVTLDGSASSDTDGDTLTFSWNFIARPGGSNAFLSSITSIKPTFVADVEGDYVVRLVVNDGKTNSQPNTVTVTATSRPVAIAGPDQNVAAGSIVTLDGSSSLHAAAFSWTITSKPNGSTATLSSSSAIKPTFFADADGIYEITLVVTDGLTNSQPDFIIVTAATDPIEGPAMANTPWPGFQGNNQRTGLSTVDTSANNGYLKWSHYIGAITDSSPVIGLDGTIYLGNVEGDVVAINPDGTRKWAFRPAERGFDTYTAVVASNGTIYIPAWAGKLHAINPDGTLKWSYSADDSFNWTASPAIGADGTIYMGAGLNLYAIHPGGTLKWAYYVGSSIRGTPAIGLDGTIYVGANKVYALNPDGSLKRSYLAGSGVIAAPTIGADGTIFVGSNDRNIYAIDQGGGLKWTYTTGNAIHTSPAIGPDGTIYVASDDGKLYALDYDGTFKWVYEAGNILYGSTAMRSSPAVGSDGSIYFGTWGTSLSNMNFFALNPNGTLKWTNSALSSPGSASPAIGADGTVYFVNRGGTLFAFE